MGITKARRDTVSGFFGVQGGLTTDGSSAWNSALSLGEQVIKDAIKAGVGHFFRVELHADHASIRGFDAFDDAIYTAGTDVEFRADCFNGLKVKAVGLAFGLA